MVKRRKRSNAFEQFSGDSKRFRNESILHQDDTENSVPENKPLYGREKEVALLEKPLHEGIVNRSPASIFVSGPPGTGKTLAVKTVLQHMLSQHNVHSIYINCASEDTEWDILTVMLNSYNKSSRRPPGKKLITEFHKVLAKMNKHTIIVLDEIDYIRPKDRGSLCSMFQWPFLYDNVSVIGIANTLDTMELLKHKLKSVPVLIVFAPYTEVQLQLILSKKLKNNKDGDAIELCARKVAAITGDARKALQVARRSLSIDLSNGNTSCRNVFGTLTSVYGSPMLQAKIPLQQKILLATMLRLVGDNSSTTVEKSCLLSTYKKLCEFLLLPALEMDEIHEALSLLESQSILKLKSSSYQLLVDKAAAGKLIADSSLISQINTARLTEKY
uniref:AAA domain-containing protein n=2 Tax=Onchocerca TaxID=6281 RepID=A0A8R1XXG4_ONCVO